ncbi:MAG: GHKL domain-containing protein [Defluviitaleaceae bacterium]|nr:GHKL domain-containing protein [Defluviitaleaceae bacterium]MCL2274027.1 GHKL domain-containing protein [Defluviitaleaceae bacterium]MCL2274072.1 GHKL domain-containing protein [Defluviitaleaceae bacterium]
MGIMDFLFNRMIDRRIANFHSDLMKKHITEVENIYTQMRGWRHDYHSHIQTLKAHRALNENEKIDAYLENLETDLHRVDTLIKSGNVSIDAILNSKLSLAVAQDITVNAKALVPQTLSVSEIDLCIIIGNLLDNAIEACLRINNPEARFIRYYMDIKRDNLYISVTNASGGLAVKEKGRYFSSKGAGHGLGLTRVDRVVEKYDGYIKRSDEEGAFSSEIMLPLD